MEIALFTPVGEEMRPREVIATAIIATFAVQQSPQLGEERMALGFTQRPGWKARAFTSWKF
jgi:hypothetical protein